MWLLSAELLSNAMAFETVEIEEFVEVVDVEVSFVFLFEITAAAIWAPRDVHLFASLHLAGSKVLIKMDNAVWDELELEFELFVIVDWLVPNWSVEFANDVVTGERHMAFKSFKIPSSIRISRSILLFSSSFLE